MTQNSRMAARGFILQASYRNVFGPDGVRTPVVHLFGRLEEGGTFAVRDDRQRPHFYIRSADVAPARALRSPETQPADRRTFAGEAASRIEVATPSRMYCSGA